MTKSATGVWIVGYGSLIYKPPPHWKYRVPGVVHGFVRRFWQSSIDHRGTPESPGRVATLIPYDTLLSNKEYRQDLELWKPIEVQTVEDLQLLAVAYYIPPDQAEAVTEYLDIREKNGYTTQKIHIHLAPGDTKNLELQALLDQLPIHEASFWQTHIGVDSVHWHS